MNRRLLFNLILAGGLISCGSNKKTVTYKHYNPKKYNKAVVVIPKEDLDDARAVFNRIKNIAIDPSLVTLEYIDDFAPLAMIEMNRYKIPASITLAQAILESKSGMSELSLKSNNHFGVKCHKDWQGKKVYYDDDVRHECFRKYNHPIGSFKDHSLFLKNGKRYSFLFRLKKDDYKGWAYGLKKAGYATDPRYPQKLIKIINNYHLSQYDTEVLYHQINKKQKAIARVKAKADKNNKVYINPVSKEINIQQVKVPDSTALFITNEKTNKNFDKGFRINTLKVVNGKMVYAITSSKPTKRPAKEIAGNNVKKIIKQPIKKPAKISTKKPIIQKNKQLAKQLANKTTIKPAKEIASNAVKKTVKQPAKKPIKISIKKPVNQPNKQLANNPIKKTIKKPVKTPNNYKLDIQKLKTPVKPPSKKLVNQPIDKLPTKKLVLNSIKKSVKQPTSILIKPVKAKIYKVKKGETLYAISKKFNVEIIDLKTWNNLSSNNLKVGQEIVIKKQDKQVSDKSAEAKIYKVKKGETLYAISKKFNVKIIDLKTWNNLTSNELKIGQKIIIKK